jgi:hypothetical protein
VVPQGLDAHDSEHARLLKTAFEEWEDNQQRERVSPAIHRAWIDFVLKQTLDLPDEVIAAEGREIAPTLKVAIAEHGSCRHRVRECRAEIALHRGCGESARR